MGFAAKWAAVLEEAHPPVDMEALGEKTTSPPDLSAWEPKRIIRTIRTIPPSGVEPAHSANTANIAPWVSVQATAQFCESANIAPRGSNPKGTGLEWIVWPDDDTDPDFNARWAAYDLADLCRLYAVRIVAAGKRVLAIYPPALEPELVAYAGSHLAEARPYLAANVDKLPILPPTDAVEIVKDVMRKHKGLRFCRGEAGSRWPIYPREWTAGQRATLQGLWFAAGAALDRDDFKEIDQ